jgi:hypothetical protein
MKNHINITGMSDDRSSRAHHFITRFQRPASNPYYNIRLSQQKKTGPLVYEWQLEDSMPEKSGKVEDGNSFVADWQMISQDSDRAR